jgi:hypothetical protein
VGIFLLLKYLLMMIDLIRKVIVEENRRILNEGGIRDIRDIAKRYQMAKIYFHLDLDGVTTSLAMKNYLERNGIKVVEAEPIQYGAKEFAVKKPEGEGEIMPVLVDFAHGKPMFVIHTDHHDSQAGVEGGTSINFKPARSNVETISQSVSPSEIFPPEDVETISIIDSADFAKHDIKPRDVINYLFQIDRTKGFKENKRKMGFVANKLLLAFKNKPGFLSDIVLNAQPSLLSILIYIKKQIEDIGYATLDKLEQNKEAYIESRKLEGAVDYSDGVISQYGFGSTMKPGSYDRYTPFENYPDADFLVTGMPLGMVQASCNPYKKERALKGVNLGEVKDEVLNKLSSELKAIPVTFGDLKRIGEQEAEYGSVGFTLKDFMAIYGNTPSLKINGGESLLKIVGNISENLYRKLSDKQKDILDRITVDGLDVINANSGGHKCITNISGISFLLRKRGGKTVEVEEIPSELQPIANYQGSNNFVNDIKNKLKRFGSLSDKQRDIALQQIEKEGAWKKGEVETPTKTFIDLVKDIQAEFIRTLKEKIKNSKEGVSESFVVSKRLVKAVPLNFSKKKDSTAILSEQQVGISLPIKLGPITWKSPKRDADLLHSFERRKVDKQGAYIGTQIGEQLKKVYNAGINPDVVDFQLSVNSKDYTVTWSAIIDESKDGKAYMGVATRGSAGGGSDRRALGQVEPLKQQLTKGGAQDITLILDFKNPTGVPIRQYFFKYTLPEKYPPRPAGSGKYTRTEDPVTAQVGSTGSGTSTNTTQNQSPTGALNFDFKGLFSGLKNAFQGNTQQTPTQDTTTQQTPTQDSTTQTSDVSLGGGSSNFDKITKTVINKFEGGYWNPFCPSHPKGSMGKSTETMFGLDRYNGNIESSSEGKQFFKIIDDLKIAAGAQSSGEGKNMKWSNMDKFCQKWKWNSRGGDKEDTLKNLAVAIMKRSFDRNMSSFVKDPKVKQKIESIPGLTLHMSYASWNGPGFFKKFAGQLDNGVKQGLSDKQLIDLAIQSRAQTKLLNKDKVAAAIKNPSA